MSRGADRLIDWLSDVGLISLTCVHSIARMQTRAHLLCHLYDCHIDVPNSSVVQRIQLCRDSEL
jgi:hypothetical protein